MLCSLLSMVRGYAISPSIDCIFRVFVIKASLLLLPWHSTQLLCSLHYRRKTTPYRIMYRLQREKQKNTHNGLNNGSTTTTPLPIFVLSRMDENGRKHLWEIILKSISLLHCILTTYSVHRIQTHCGQRTGQTLQHRLQCLALPAILLKKKTWIIIIF